MQQLRIELSEDKQWQWKVYGKNGQNTATSETLTRKHDAERSFDDHADIVLMILAERGDLKSSIERLGLLVDNQAAVAKDAVDAVLNILADKEALIDALERNGLLEKLNNALGAPSGVQDFVGQRPPERPPRKPSSLDDLGV
jgi:uncharacterized protein YegP (UPF0339 family)